MKTKKAKKLLRKVVQEITDCKRLFSNQPKKDFTRNRKLPFEQIIKAILCMGGGSVANEMMDLFGFREDLATTSAFVQQRAKILPEAFENLFDLFVKNTSERSTYRGLQLLAVDGSDFRVITTKCGSANGLGGRFGDCRSGGKWLRSDCQHFENHRPSELPA